MLVSRTLITLVPLISAGCGGFRRFVGRICENRRQICGNCVLLYQAIPRFTNNVFVLPIWQEKASNSKYGPIHPQMAQITQRKEERIRSICVICGYYAANLELLGESKERAPC